MRHVILLLLIISVLVSGCQTYNNSDSFSQSMIGDLPTVLPTEQRILTSSVLYKISLQVNEGAVVDLSEIGLHDLVVKQKVKVYDSTTQKVARFAYLLCRDCCDDASRYDVYLTIETDENLLVYDLGNPCLDVSLYSNDIDGDGANDLVVQQCIDVFGGVGTFLSRVFSVQENCVVELYNSSLDFLGDNQTMPYHTGFSSKFLENYRLEITNKSVGFRKIIDLSGRYAEGFFDEAGKGKLNLDIHCDSFMEFVPKDVDGDGVFEILCSQYASLYGHADGIGYAKSVLKFDERRQALFVAYADFDVEDSSVT